MAAPGIIWRVCNVQRAYLKKVTSFTLSCTLTQQGKCKEIHKAPLRKLSWRKVCFQLVGHHCLMDSTLGSGDRVRGFKSRSQRSGFFSGLFSSSFFFFPRHVSSLSHNACWPMNSGFTAVYGGGKKRINMEKS